MSAVRTALVATLECGTLDPLGVRLELPDAHMWLYPQADGTVLVEFEDKGFPADETCAAEPRSA